MSMTAQSLRKRIKTLSAENARLSLRISNLEAELALERRQVAHADSAADAAHKEARDARVIAEGLGQHVDVLIHTLARVQGLNSRGEFRGSTIDRLDNR